MVTTHVTKYSRMDQVKFVEDSRFNFFKGCLPQILLGPLNILSHMFVNSPGWHGKLHQTDPYHT